MAQAKDKKLKLLAVGSACVTILALIIAVFFYSQNSSQADSIARLSKENGELKSQNRQLERDLASARLEARTNYQQGLSGLASMYQSLSTQGNLSGITTGFPGGVGGGLGGSQMSPELIQQLLTMLQNSNGSLKPPIPPSSNTS